MSKRPLAIADHAYPFANLPNPAEPKPRKRKSRWSVDDTERTLIPGMPTQLPPNLSPDQEKVYILQLQVEDVTRRLKSAELGIPKNPMDRSPSPEPIYSSDGKRLNTREYRTRKKLEDERHNLIMQLSELNPEYKPPTDYKAPQNRITDRVFIPQDENPDINFVGLLIGPRGNTLKALEKDTGAKVIIRGKGSVKEGKVGRRDGLPLPGEDEPLHAFVTASTAEAVDKAVKKITEVIRQGIDIPESQNDLRRNQLRELALLNGTLREHEGLMKLRAMAEAQTIATNQIQCSICGGAGHLSSDCKVNLSGLACLDQLNSNPSERAKMDSEYSALMAELGAGVGSQPPPGFGSRLASFSSQGPKPPKQPPPPGVSVADDDDEPPASLAITNGSIAAPTPASSVSTPMNLPPPPLPYGSMAPLQSPWPMMMPGAPPVYHGGPPPSAMGYHQPPPGPPPGVGQWSNAPQQRWPEMPHQPPVMSHYGAPGQQMHPGAAYPPQMSHQTAPPGGNYWSAWSSGYPQQPPPPPPPGV